MLGAPRAPQEEQSPGGAEPSRCRAACEPCVVQMEELPGGERVL